MKKEEIILKWLAELEKLSIDLKKPDDFTDGVLISLKSRKKTIEEVLKDITEMEMGEFLKGCTDPDVLTGNKRCFVCTHESCPSWR